MRRLPTLLGRVAILVAAFLATASFLAASSGTAQAQDGDTPSVDRSADGTDDAVVDIVQISGLIDPTVASLIDQSIDRAEREGVATLILQVNSPGAVIDDARLTELARRLRDSQVPTAAWVGPAGSSALGGAAQLVGVVDQVGIAIGSRIGETGEQVLPMSEFGALFEPDPARVVDATIGRDDALTFGLIDASTALDFVVQVDSVPTKAVVVEINGEDQDLLEPTATVRFSKLAFTNQVMHTVASPAVAYLLFTMGLALLLFEYFTAGIGVAGVVAAICVVLGCYGLGVLPTRWSGILLLVLSFLAFAVDVQAGVPRFWTGVGFLLFAVGTLRLYDGVSNSWVTVMVVGIGMVLTFLSGMPSMVRTRFSTPTIGRDWMIGEYGIAISDVAPDGEVSVRDAPWRAQTNRATPLVLGDRVRVIGLNGVVLEVEPIEGAAKDYRDRG